MYKINKRKSWYKNIDFDNKKKLGIYIDKHGKKHIVYNKCPHLGSSLIFNEQEKHGIVRAIVLDLIWMVNLLKDQVIIQ